MARLVQKTFSKPRLTSALHQNSKRVVIQAQIGTTKVPSITHLPRPWAQRSGDLVTATDSTLAQKAASAIKEHITQCERSRAWKSAMLEILKFKRNCFWVSIAT